MTKISGTLIDGAGNALPNVQIVLTAIKTSNTVLNQIKALIATTSEDGKYDINVEIGSYAVTVLRDGFPIERVGTIEVLFNSEDGTLNDFLLLPKTGQTVTSDLLQQISDERKLAQKAASGMQGYADSANNSANEAKKSADSALLSIDNARKYAESAKASHEGASSSASLASSLASNAKNSENEAEKFAKDAKSSATSSNDSAKQALEAKNSVEDILKNLPEIIEGPKGDDGKQGIQGTQGIQGEKGEPGKDGINGKDGKTIELSDSVDSNSTTIAASSSAVKQVYDFTKAISDKSLIIGDFKLFPFRKDNLPSGWYFRNGDNYLLSSPQGQVLNSLSDNFKLDHNITIKTVDGLEYINVPNAFNSSGYGYFERAVDGVNRQVGSIQDDASRNISGWLIYIGHRNFTKYSSNTGVFNTPKIHTTHSPSNTQINSDSNPYQELTTELNSSRVVPTANENRPINYGLTPAIYLGV